MRLITKNKFAFLNYDVEKQYETGIVLKGFEVKSIKTGQVNIKDSIIKIYNNEIYITNMDIPLYEKTYYKQVKSYEQKGQRKLLLTRNEINKIIEKTNKTGLTIIALEVFENKNRLIKLKIGVGKLRKKIEKKQIIKERDIDRQAKKEIKNIKFN